MPINRYSIRIVAFWTCLECTRNAFLRIHAYFSSIEFQSKRKRERKYRQLAMRLPIWFHFYSAKHLCATKKAKRSHKVQCTVCTLHSSRYFMRCKCVYGFIYMWLNIKRRHRHRRRSPIECTDDAWSSSLPISFHTFDLSHSFARTTKETKTKLSEWIFVGFHSVHIALFVVHDSSSIGTALAINNSSIWMAHDDSDVDLFVFWFPFFRKR